MKTMEREIRELRRASEILKERSGFLRGGARPPLAAMTSDRASSGDAGRASRRRVPKTGGLERDLEAYLRFYHEERAHDGRITAGRTPFRALIGARKLRPR
jgi:hypothetical protein